MSKSPRRHRRHSSAFKICDFSIAALISEISHAKNQQEEAIILKRHNSLELIQHILTNTQRENCELDILSKYLQTLPQLMSLLQKSEGDINVLLNIIAKNLKYERLMPNTLICRLGERGEKFYVILKGEASILIPKEFHLNITLFNYVKHILLLLIKEEQELAVITIKINKMCYNADLEVYLKFIEEHTNSIVYFMSFDQLEIMQLKAYVANLIIEYEEKRKCSVITVQDYIQSSYPDASIISASNIKGSEFIKGSIANPIVLYIYFEVVKQSDGASFGEIALINQNNKRTATIICEKEISLGALTRKVFNGSIKDLHKKKQQNNIRFLQSFKIFNDISYQMMMYKFLNYFKIMTIEQNEIIINENTIADEVYFIQNGEFELSAKMSNEEIESYIRINKGDKNYRFDDNSSSEHNKRSIRLAIIKENDIIGLHDMIYANHYIFSARCVSLQAIVFSIKLKLFEAIAHKIKDVYKKWKKFTLLRRKMFVSRIESYYHYVKSNKSNNQKLLPIKTIDKIRQFFSVKPKPKAKEVNRNKTYATPVKLKPPYLSRVFSGTENTIMNLPYYFQQDIVPKRILNKNDEDYKNTLNVIPNKSRNNRPLSSFYDGNTITTAFNYTFTNANPYDDGCNLRKSTHSMRLSSSLLKSTTKKKQFGTAYKPEKFLKRIIGSGFKKIDTQQTLVTQLSTQHNEARNLSSDRTIIDPLSFEKLETQTQGNLPNLKKRYHRVYSPSTLPLNYMEKAKPWRITIKKKSNKPNV